MSMNNKPLPDNGSNERTNTQVRQVAVLADKKFQSAAMNLKKLVQIKLMAMGAITEENDLTHFSGKLIGSIDDIEISEQYDSLMNSFEVKDEELWAYLMLTNTTSSPSPVTIDLEENNEYVTLNIYPWAKLSDITNSWKAIQQQLKSKHGYVTRIRGPDNPALLHAIHQARKLSPKTTWKQLALQVNSNNLESYDFILGDNKTWDEGTLKAYYHKYKDYVVLK